MWEETKVEGGISADGRSKRRQRRSKDKNLKSASRLARNQSGESRQHDAVTSEREYRYLGQEGVRGLAYSTSSVPRIAERRFSDQHQPLRL